MVDLVGPLELESEGYRYILTAMDVFSLWSWLTPLESKDPKEVAGALHGYVYMDLAGFPLILRSDNGSEFVADVTRELNRTGSLEPPRYLGRRTIPALKP